MMPEGIMSRAILGLDIGGANLKAALLAGADTACLSRRFALWRNAAGLADALADLIKDLPTSELVAVTMTGELCDCFTSKREGILHILTAVEQAIPSRPIHVWATDGRFRTLEDARSSPPLLIASANWLALANYVGRLIPKGSGLLIDIGSTTSDIIPLVNGIPVPKGRTDPERLRSHELVYTGVRRTPVSALASYIIAAELFATSLDGYLVLGDIPPDPLDCDTADGRPATVEHAHARLARMLCADLESSTEAERKKLASTFRGHQLSILGQAVETVMRNLPDAPAAIVLAGSGEFLGRYLLQWRRSLAWRPIQSLAEQLGPDISMCACAYAVAVLCGERVSGS
jgi:(4-(4-[2-(gamma-L-glutamylamino)ethyl]phenoxymethyl)furan-2-yl)methanamine synthase